MLVLLALIVACGPGEICESDQDKQSRLFNEQVIRQLNERANEQFLPPSVTKLEAKLAVPVTTFTVTATGGGSPQTPLTYEWSMTGEACGTPVTPWKQTGPVVKWSHSDQKPDSCTHKGTDHAVDTTVVVSSPNFRVTCTIHGTEDQTIDSPKCTTAPVTPTPAPAR